MKKLRIPQAILDFENRTGKKMPEKKLAGIIWPELKPNNRQVRLSNLITGKTKRIDIETARKLCKTLEIDYNFLFGE